MEHEFHQWLKQLSNDPRSADVRIGIGDDGALLKGDDQDLVVATDTIAEGTHFDLGIHSLELIGRKSIAVNLSDIAAMGAKPTTAVVTLLLPRSFEIEKAKSLFSGIRKIATQFQVTIVGGDTNTWDGPLVVGATLMGKRSASQSGWTIDGAQPGDVIFVSGEFGGSIHGRHLSFQPRVDLARYLVDNYSIHGATDASDSLSLDLSAMIKFSGFGADISLKRIPISSDVKATDYETRIQHAISDGEDFELILALPSDQAQRLEEDPNVPTKLTRIGKFTSEHQEMRDGGRVVQAKGYEH